MQPDWDTWWRWEGWRRRLDPIDFRRWKACSSRALRALPAGRDRPQGAPRLLDATCGMGLHTVIQHELGFVVEGMDASPVALGLARETLAAAGVERPLHQARWSQAGTLRTAPFDLVFADGLHQLHDRASFAEALTGLRDALVPGGALVFFFADAEKPDDGEAQCDWEWAHAERERVAWRHDDGHTAAELVVTLERVEPRLILEQHRYRWRRGGESGIDTVSLPRSYRWDLATVTPELRRAGLSRVDSARHSNVHGRRFAMNLAYRD